MQKLIQVLLLEENSARIEFYSIYLFGIHIKIYQ